MVAAAAALCALLLLGWYRGIFRPDVAQDARLFDYLHYIYDTTEADPFMNPLRGQLLFNALCAGGVALGFSKKQAVFRRVGMAAFMGLIVSVGGGLYLNLAPDFLKIPCLLPLNFTRGLWWPQYVVYMGIAAACLAVIQRGMDRPKVLAALGVLAALYFVPFRLKRVAFFGLFLALLWAGRRLTGRLRDPLRVLAIALGLTTVSALTFSALTQRPYFQFLLKHGIMGDNPGSKWVGVNEYIRRQTPPSATVLAFSMWFYRWRPEGFGVDSSLRTRTGRTMPLGPEFVFYFDYEKLQWAKTRSEFSLALGKYWEAHDLPRVISILKFFGSPDYLVVPSHKAEWLLAAGSSWPYRVEKLIGDYTILRKENVPHA